MRLPKPFGFDFCLDEQKACPDGALFSGQAWHIKNQGRFWAFVEDTGKPGTRSSCYVPVAIYIIRKVMLCAILRGGFGGSVARRMPYPKPISQDLGFQVEGPSLH